MTNPNDEFPEVRLSDALFGDGFPEWGPRTDLSDAVIADGLDRLREMSVSAGEASAGMQALTEQLKAQTRAAKEIRAAHADPHWLEP
jgi:hypothetical protein